MKKILINILKVIFFPVNLIGSQNITFKISNFVNKNKWVIILLTTIITALFIVFRHLL